MTGDDFLRDSFLVFGQPDIRQEEINEVVDSLKKGWLGTGAKVQRFERLFAAYKNTPYSAAVNSCTAALHLSCIALGLKPKDEVITTAMTFCSTVNAIIHAGATPVLADIDSVTLNVSVKEIERKITKRTKAIVVVHFAGRPCDMDPIMELARKRKLAIIEDCAHAIETEYRGEKAGTMGDFGCFSFYATKNIVCGEGGMVISRNKRMIDRIKVLALHGMSKDAWKRFSDSGYKHYYVEEAGFKYNMMDLQAAIGIHQLKRVDDYWKKRQAIWQKYITAFQKLGIGLPAPVEAGTRHAYHLFTIRINKQRIGISRDDFLNKMTKCKIGVGVHYWAIPEHPFYRRRFGWEPQDYPHALSYGRETVSLPLSPKLTDRDTDDVVSVVIDTVSQRHTGR